MLGRFSLLIVSAHASERMEYVSAMRASSTTVAYCSELAESSTHRANKISVAWDHYLAHASVWANRFAGCILPNMKTIGLLLIVAVVALDRKSTRLNSSH